MSRFSDKLVLLARSRISRYRVFQFVAALALAACLFGGLWSVLADQNYRQIALVPVGVLFWGWIILGCSARETRNRNPWEHVGVYERPCSWHGSQPKRGKKGICFLVGDGLVPKDFDPVDDTDSLRVGQIFQGVRQPKVLYILQGFQCSFFYPGTV